MSVILDPNLAYVILVVGFVLSILVLFTPGTGVLELGALFALVIAGYGIVNLPVNLWAMVILLIGVVPFIFAVRKTRKWWYLLISIIALDLGSIFVFQNPTGGLAINPFLATLVTISATVILWIIVTKGLEAISQTPIYDPENVIGQIGEARTDINPEGTVYLGSEEWTARSETVILEGAKVKVVRREGLILSVEPVKHGAE